MTFRQTATLCLLLAELSACTPAPPRAVGDWNGLITTSTGELPLIVHVRSAAPDGGNSLESPEQSPGELIPIRVTAATDDALAFDVPSLKASYKAGWNATANQWSGEWMQSGYHLPLNLSAGPGNTVVKGLDGTWQAKVVRPTGTFRLILRIETKGRGTSIKFDAPDAGATNLSVSPFQRSDRHITFGIPATGARFDGRLEQGDIAMVGTWTFPQQPPTAVTFSHVNAPKGMSTAAATSPPYAVRTISIANKAAPGVVLACTLTTPLRQAPFPVVAFATGSGAQDRDEAIYGHKPFAAIADDLSRKGFATLRCDDRGVAASTGTFNDATTLEFASDLNAQVAFLQSRSDMRPGAIYLLGHSEGALVSIIAAGANPHIGGLVLLGAPGTNLREVLLVQRRMIGEAQGQTAAVLAETLPIVERILDAVAASEGQADAEKRIRAILTPDVRAKLRLNVANAELFVQQMASPWMRQFLRLDIPGFLSRVRAPVLALAGSLDRQVEPTSNLDALRSGLTQTRDVTLRVLEGLNHFMQRARTGAPSEYASITEDINPSALQAISEWLLRHETIPAIDSPHAPSAATHDADQKRETGPAR